MRMYLVRSWLWDLSSSGGKQEAVFLVQYILVECLTLSEMSEKKSLAYLFRAFDKTLAFTFV